MKRQLIAQHYCAHLSDEVLQCVLYDSEKKDARLIGVEYIVSAKIFESLPADEKIWIEIRRLPRKQAAAKPARAGRRKTARVPQRLSALLATVRKQARANSARQRKRAERA